MVPVVEACIRLLMIRCLEVEVDKAVDSIHKLRQAQDMTPLGLEMVPNVADWEDHRILLVGLEVVTLSSSAKLCTIVKWADMESGMERRFGN